MSDTGIGEKKKLSLDEKLEATFVRLRTTSIFFCLGWTIASIFIVGIYHINSFLGILGFAIGWIVAASPMIGRMWTGGFKNAFKLPEYEVVTTYADGSKKNDGGLKSKAVNIGVQIFFGIIMIVIGVAITILYLIFLTMKYLILYLRVKSKPSFLKSGLLIIVVNIIVFLGAVLIGYGIQYNVKSKNPIQASNEPIKLETTIQADQKEE